MTRSIFPANSRRSIDWALHRGHRPCLRFPDIRPPGSNLQRLPHPPERTPFAVLKQDSSQGNTGIEIPVKRVAYRPRVGATLCFSRAR